MGRGGSQKAPKQGKPGAAKQPGGRAPRRHRTTLTVLTVALLVIAGLIFIGARGCRRDVETVYGQRAGSSWRSVNGTGVLGKMFAGAGHAVYSRRILSPSLRHRADVIVWFPNDFGAPPDDACEWLEGWLADGPGRTLIYVGRDFDAAAWYWDAIQDRAPEDQRQEALRRELEAKSEFLQGLLPSGTTEECDWFAVKGGQKRREVRTLQGSDDWVEGIDPSKLEVEINQRMIPSQAAEVLLASQGDALVFQERVGQGRLIVVANGSFLLNLPLVVREHRKLAGRLIDQVGPPRQTVVFLESGPAGPIIFETDPDARPPSALAIFDVWPANWILLHLAIAGVIFCFCRFPIFGRARDVEPEATSDFGRHVEALGELLERTGDASHAAARLAHCRQLAHPEAAARREAIRTDARKAGRQRAVRR